MMDNTVEEYAKVFNAAKKLAGEAGAVAILDQVGKDKRLAEIQRYRSAMNGSMQNSTSNNDEQPATEKQLEYLRDLGVQVSPSVSRTEASRLIDEAVAR